MAPIIELRHVDKHFGDLHVLKDVSLSVGKGEVVVVIGPSGSGKSTLCRAINRLETIDSGEILIEGKPLPQEGRELAAMRAELGMVFQSFNLFAHMSILQNVTLGPVEVLGLSKPEAEKRAMELLERVGVASAELGGGRVTMDDQIDHSCGITLLKNYGDPVEDGEPVAIVHANDAGKLATGLATLAGAYTYGPQEPPVEPLLYASVTAAGVAYA